MSASRPQYTAEALLRMTSPGKQYELVRGELVEMTPPGFRHGEIIVRIAHLLREHVRPRRLGRVVCADPGFLLERNPDTVLAPDVAFVSYQRLPPGDSPTGYPALAPELVVEVMSPSDSPGDVQAKTEAWLSFGVDIVWLVDPSTRTVAVYEGGKPVRLLSETDRLSCESPLPELDGDIREFFED